jgi:hypothetical protein
VQLEGLRQLKESNDLIGIRTRDLPVCSISASTMFYVQKISRLSKRQMFAVLYSGGRGFKSERTHLMHCLQSFYLSSLNAKLSPLRLPLLSAVNNHLMSFEPHQSPQFVEPFKIILFGGGDPHSLMW